jgi:uncharacterized membrane protein YfcA
VPIQLAYQLDGKIHYDSTNLRISVRAPLKAVILGAIVGAFLGSALNNLVKYQGIQNLTWGSFWWTAVINCLSSMLTIIMLARKREAQPFVTVEDFLGGMFIGVLVGYGGQDLLRQILPNHS